MSRLHFIAEPTSKITEIYCFQPDEAATTPRIINLGLEPIPHMCHTTGPSDNRTHICDVYTPSSDPIPFEISLKPHKNDASSNETDSFCRYPIGKFIS